MAVECAGQPLCIGCGHSTKLTAVIQSHYHLERRLARMESGKSMLAMPRNTQ